MYCLLSAKKKAQLLEDIKLKYHMVKKTTHSPTKHTYHVQVAIITKNRPDLGPIHAFTFNVTQNEKSQICRIKQLKELFTTNLNVETGFKLFILDLVVKELISSCRNTGYMVLSIMSDLFYSIDVFLDNHLIVRKSGKSGEYKFLGYCNLLDTNKGGTVNV